MAQVLENVDCHDADVRVLMDQQLRHQVADICAKSLQNRDGGIANFGVFGAQEGSKASRHVDAANVAQGVEDRSANGTVWFRFHRCDEGRDICVASQVLCRAPPDIGVGVLQVRWIKLLQGFPGLRPRLWNFS